MGFFYAVLLQHSTSHQSSVLCYPLTPFQQEISVTSRSIIFFFHIAPTTTSAPAQRTELHVEGDKSAVDFDAKLSGREWMDGGWLTCGVSSFCQAWSGVFFQLKKAWQLAYIVSTKPDSAPQQLSHLMCLIVAYLELSELYFPFMLIFKFRQQVLRLCLVFFM